MQPLLAEYVCSRGNSKLCAALLLQILLAAAPAATQGGVPWALT
jgi:hypothetical protein